MANKVQIVLFTIIMTAVLAPADSGRKVVSNPDPAYPELAQKNNLHGTVKIKVWISPSGEVRRLEYIGGHPVLAESALKTLKTWKYEPSKSEDTLVIEVKF